MRTSVGWNRYGRRLGFLEHDGGKGFTLQKPFLDGLQASNVAAIFWIKRRVGAQDFSPYLNIDRPRATKAEHLPLL